MTGGANWQGGSFDPETKRFYIFTNVAITSLSLAPPESGRSDMLYVRGAARNPNPPRAGGRRRRAGGGGGGGLNVRGLPLIKPPYATITAIDMNKGELLWKIAHGETPDNVKNNPALKGVTIPRTGRTGRIGVLTTKTLLIAGEGGFATTPDGRGAYLRAYDKGDGRGSGPGVHAGAADRIADDLLDERHAVHRRRGQRTWIPGRAAGLQARSVRQANRGNLRLLFRGNAQLGRAIVRQSRAEQRQHLLGALPRRAHDEDESEALEIGVVAFRERGQHVVVGGADARLFLRRQIVRGGKARSSEARSPIRG